MKRIFYFATAAFAACAMLVSCDKDDDKKPNNPPTPDPDQPTKLATPSVTYEVGETEVTVSWEAVANAASYEYTVDGGTATTTEETTFTLAVADLAAGNHTVSVTALPEDGSEEYTKSDAGTATFNIEEVQEPIIMPEEFAPYIGVWTVTTTQTMNVTQESVTFDNQPMTFDVNIAWDEIGGSLIMTGFSATMEELMGGEIAAQILPDETGKIYICGGDLGIDLAQLDPSLSGYSLSWVPMFPLQGSVSCAVPGDSPIAAYELTMNVDENTMTATGVTMDFGEQTGTQKMQAFDLVGMGPQNFSLLVQQSPAGDFTFTKISNNSPAPATSVNYRLPVTLTLTSNALSAMTISPIAR